MMKEIPDRVRTYLPLTRALLISSAGCLLMVVLRILLTGSFRFGSLLWNLFLAWIPYILCLFIRRIAVTGASEAKKATPLWFRPGLVVLGLLWLLFYPNAPYILTDFIHLFGMSRRTPLNHPLLTENTLLWYDIILNAAFAFIGHFIGLISLVILQRTIRDLNRRGLSWLMVVLASGLGGYGIFLGRFERLNSWDILRFPLFTLRTGLLNLFNLKAVLFSLCFAFFIFLTYLIVYFFYETARKT
jgi:uncharacterized membrane protein